MVINVRKVAEVNLEGGVVVDGFPSAGLVNAIASECIIHSTKTKMAAVLDSPDFPTLSTISDYLPHFPACIYANEDLKIAFFVTELEIDKAMYREVAETMLKWAPRSSLQTHNMHRWRPYGQRKKNIIQLEIKLIFLQFLA